MMKDIEKEQAVKQLPEIEIKALLPDDDIYINTDATRLKQVICNFINNARKFTEKGYIRKNARKRYSTVSIRSILSNKVRG